MAKKLSVGPVAEILRSVLVDPFKNLQKDGPAIRSLIASAQDDPDFRASFRDRFVRPRARIVSEILQKAQRRGEVPLDAEIDTAIGAFHGAFWYRPLQAEPLDAAFAERLAAFVLRGVRSNAVASPE